MQTNATSKWHNLVETISSFKHPRVVTMLFFGFSAGLPILLIFSSLSLWLREAGVARSAVTYFSWAALGYSFKFVWAPLVDRLPIPILTKMLGRRRSWILFAQAMIMVAIAWMASVDPASGQNQLTFMALAAVLLGFSSATQDIVIDAYRIESAGIELQALMSSTYIAGYRIGMLVAGAGALYLASYFGTSSESYNYQAWNYAYLIMASCMFIGVATTLMIPEPQVHSGQKSKLSTKELVRFLGLFVSCVLTFIAIFYFTKQISTDLKATLTESLHNKHLASFIVEILRLGLAVLGTFCVGKLITLLKLVNREVMHTTYVAPIQDFFTRYKLQGAWLLLALIGIYRISDIVLGVISNVFYQDIGFTKVEIASVVKTFGLFMTLAGGFLGGLLCVRHGVLKILLLGAVLSSATNLLFMLLANMGNELWLLTGVISADNLAQGIASAAFIAFLSALTNIKFTAMQYAIFSSLMTLLPKILGGYSGSIVDSVGYSTFFLMTALIGVPVIFLILKARTKVDLQLPE